MRDQEGTVGNADLWRVTFVGANDLPVDPDGPVTWEVNGEVVETQAVDEHVETGVYELLYTPDAARPYTVKALTVVGGVDQATAAEERHVRP